MNHSATVDAGRLKGSRGVTPFLKVTGAGEIEIGE
jgi:hypothetical protein